MITIYEIIIAALTHIFFEKNKYASLRQSNIPHSRMLELCGVDDGLFFFSIFLKEIHANAAITIFEIIITALTRKKKNAYMRISKHWTLLRVFPHVVWN